MTNSDDHSVPDPAELFGFNKTLPYAGEEVSAAYRKGAGDMRQFYVSLVQAGFTKAQAWSLLQLTIQSAAGRGNDGT